MLAKVLKLAIVIIAAWYSIPQSFQRKLYSLFQKYFNRKITPNWKPSKPLTPTQKTKPTTEIQEKPTIKSEQIVDEKANKEFENDVNEAIEWMEKTSPLSQDWQLMQTTNDIKVYRLSVPDLSLPFVRGQGIIKGPWSPEEVLSVVRNAYSRKSWDARFELAKILKYPDVSTSLTYSVQKGTWPVGARDFVTINKAIVNKDSVLYLSHSVSDKHYQGYGEDGRTRAHLLLAGWRLERSELGIQTSYIFHVDVKGDIPLALIRTVQLQTPQCIRTVGEYLAANGPLSFIIRSAKWEPKVVLLKEQIEDNDVFISFKSNGSESFVIALSKRFAQGFEISSDQVVNAALIPKEQWSSDFSSEIAYLVRIWSDKKPLENPVINLQISAREGGIRSVVVNFEK